MKLPFRPLHDRIVVKRDDPPKMIGLIHVPDTAHDRMKRECFRGTVVATGPGRYRQRKVSHDMHADTLFDGVGTCLRCGAEDVTGDELCPVMAHTSEREPLSVAVGDVVLFHPSACKDSEVLLFDGSEFHVMWDDEPMAVEYEDKAAE